MLLNRRHQPTLHAKFGRSVQAGVRKRDKLAADAGIEAA